jgi:serine phosphatase RsbU (regulator of sigma subunit)
MTAVILCTRAVTRTTVHSADALLSAFAAAVCGLADLGEGCVRLVGAGGPPPLPFRVGAGGEVLDVLGLPLDLIPGAAYEEVRFDVGPGDCLFLGTGGTTEINDASGRQLGSEGLLRVLQDLRYPESGVDFRAIEAVLLAYSDRIRFDDDLTFLEMRMT